MEMENNGLEIERRFLVEGGFPKNDAKFNSIEQGYICSKKDLVVRVRIINDEQGFFTIKGPFDDGSFIHMELEHEISVDEARQMLKLCEPGIIKKRRYMIPNTDGKHTFEVDVFDGNNAGLTIAEIELRDEHDDFDKPSWLGREITYDHRYSNSELRRIEACEVHKKIVYIDMDGVLVDFESGVRKAEPFFQERYKKNPDFIPGVFNLMVPMPGAVEAINKLKEKYDLYILSTASWNNPSSWMEKRQWVGRYFGDVFYKRLILTHHKELNIGDYLIDDRDRNGASEFKGQLLQFGTEQFPNWNSILKYLM